MGKKTKDQKFPFPGVAATADGSEAVVWVSTNISQGACIYPITPSTNAAPLLLLKAKG